jgi:arachidonate 15-lipoxygenase
MPQPCLPQNEPAPQQRNDNLIRQRQSYQYDYEYLPPLVLLKDLPAIENFSAPYIAERIVATAKLLPNSLATDVKSWLDPLDDLQDYEDFFTLLPLPEVAKVYQTNNSFAEQRLSGANPLVIRSLNRDDPRAQVLERIPSFQTDFEPLFDVPTELAAGNIYVTDYTGTDSNYRGPALVQGGTHEKGRKYLPKPLAFFWWRSIGVSDRGKLVPIAIQLDASTDRVVYTPTQSKVYTPFEKNPLDWLFAKFCVQIADANHHEMNTHLCRTHLVMEPFAIVTARQLADNHPLSILLRPHFLFMLTNNHLAQQRLISAGGPVDMLLAGNLAESMELVKDAYAGWNINEFALPTEIANRGMERIPHYPYRDDGMLVWNAIHTFVSGYLNHFYPTPQILVEDPELQAWAVELADQTTGGKVKGMPAQIQTVEELIEIVTTVIFICGPQHSAVNFAQDDYMTFAANMPLAGYRDIPDEPADPQESVTEEQILALLPPSKKAAEQLQILFTLSAYRYDRLGYYEKAFQELYRERIEDIFVDDSDVKNQAVVEIIEQFQQDLNVVEQEIDANNHKRVVPYVYLKPSLILNSISI